MPKKRSASKEEESLSLAEQLRQIQKELSCAYGTFEYCTDPDLIDACIYEIYALRSRFAYCIRQLKAIHSEAAG